MLAIASRIGLTVLFVGAMGALFAVLGAAKPALADPEGESVSGHVEFVNTNSGNHIRYSFHAVRHPDGTVTGEFEEHVESATGEFVRKTHGIETCLTVTGNVARVGGIVTDGTGAAPPPGTEIYSTAVDNGEGENDPADLASPGGASGPGSALAHCSRGLARPLFPITAGNVQIRP
jgi:hypothetical protein